MLFEFNTKNFKPFKEEMTFSMVPAPKQKGLDYSVLSEKIGSKIYKGLCSSVIYGPNASGNIIRPWTYSNLLFTGEHSKY